MLVQRFSMPYVFDADKIGLSTIVNACHVLEKGPQKADDLWPGKLYDISMYVGILCSSILVTRKMFILLL